MTTGTEQHAPQKTNGRVTAGNEQHTPQNTNNGITAGNEQHTPQNTSNRITAGNEQHTPKNTSTGITAGIGRRAPGEAARKLLAPYVTGGITADWTDYLLAYERAGADLIEVGLPFSDPMLDGATIQEASDRALARGATVDSILADLAATPLRVPIVVMTYANLVLRAGIAKLAAAGVSGLIVPDLPLGESAGLEAECAAAGIDLVLLVAPSTTDDRLREICRRSRGFVYAISVMGTTGERGTLAATAATLASRAKAVTDLPVLIGFGVSTPEQAAQAGRAGDGAVIGAALMRRVLDGATADDLATDVAAYRAALDLGVSPGTPHAEVSGHRG